MNYSKFNLSDKSKQGELTTVKSLSFLNTMIGIAWFVFMLIGSICIGQARNDATTQAGDAFLAFFAFAWAAVLVLAILAVITAADLQSKYGVKFGTEILVMCCLTIIIPVVFGALAYYYAEQAEKSNTTISTKTTTTVTPVKPTNPSKGAKAPAEVEITTTTTKTTTTTVEK